MTENDLSKIILDICFDIHKQLGPGLYESVYEEIICHELSLEGYRFDRQKAVPVIWNGKKLELGFRVDIILEDKLLLEIKSVENLLAVHKKQTLTYLKLTGIKLGLLINFKEALLKDGIHRLVNNL